MYVTPAILAAAENQLGRPRELDMTYEILPSEIAMIRASQRHGRAHDVTTVLHCERNVLAIAKHGYPPDVFRIPGGGLQPGEPLAAGAAREAHEETGLAFTPERYLLRVAALFTCADDELRWTTHIVSGPTSFAPPEPVDLHEIREARWVTWDELLGPITDLMLAAGKPLFAYRVALHQATFAEMTERGLL
jgi:8-oxo-dGTP pyrophosphatase MutT (NUDIX family)